MSAETIRLDPRRETPVASRQGKRFGYRYAYASSADSRTADDPGQDFLMIREDGIRLAFALCDGVSQSFYGDLAARLLGEALVDWLWQQSLSVEVGVLSANLEAYLDTLTRAASEKVAQHPIPENLPPLVRQVLEEKRALGSESTFVAGLVDTEAGAIFMAWMGDSRLRLWGSQGEFTARLGDTFHTQERWSTRRGRIGELHTARLPLSDLSFLIAYSDGLAILDRGMTRHLRDASIDAAIAHAGRSAQSDDITYFEIWRGDSRLTEARPLPPPAGLKAEIRDGQRMLYWEPVSGALQYEVELDSGQIVLVRAPSTRLELPDSGGKARLRAWDEEPGGWSQPITLPRKKLFLPSENLEQRSPTVTPGGEMVTFAKIKKFWQPLLIGMGVMLFVFGGCVLALVVGTPVLDGFLRPSPTQTQTITATQTLTPTLSSTPTPTPSPSQTQTATATLLSTFTLTPYFTQTQTITATLSLTTTLMPTLTNYNVLSAPATSIPQLTLTPDFPLTPIPTPVIHTP